MPTFNNTMSLASALDVYAQLHPTPPTGTGFLSKKMAIKRKQEDMSIPAPAPKGFTFGCDPEAFVFKGKTPVTAAGLIPGTKAEPYKVNKGWVQVDGMAAEINIEPASSFEEWNGNIATVISELEAMLPKGHSLKWIPSVEFPEKVFESAPDEAKDLGCQPDFDAWSGGVNPPPCPENPFVRCAGGHIHIGWTKDEDLSSLQHILNCQDMVKQADFFLGAWSVTKDPDPVRRTLYGKMGACRYKPYGVEYRVLSNFWVPAEELRTEIWNRMVHSVNQMNHIFLPDRIPSKLVEQIRTAINTSAMDAYIRDALEYPVLSLSPGNNRW